MNEQLILSSLIHYQQNDSEIIAEKKEKINPFPKIISISDEDAIMVYEENSHFPKDFF